MCKMESQDPKLYRIITEPGVVNAGKVHEHNLTHCEPDAMHSLYSQLQPPESLIGIR
jgi:hypothetical protein